MHIANPPVLNGTPLQTIVYETYGIRETDSILEQLPFDSLVYFPFSSLTENPALPAIIILPLPDWLALIEFQQAWSISVVSILSISFHG